MSLVQLLENKYQLSQLVLKGVRARVSEESLGATGRFGIINV